ncbi:hypothetical protein VNO78_31365 [Psophocarpus tetragonolobus]|uniref:Uncharacterized protein n=1 Tax=Psophocarpus tetragonolobus TaxID=3891 RepID=A0AAN9RZ61_PSOTE
MVAAIASNGVTKGNTEFDLMGERAEEGSSLTYDYETSEASITVHLLLPVGIFCVLLFFGTEFLMFGVPILFVVALYVLYLGIR